MVGFGVKSVKILQEHVDVFLCKVAVIEQKILDTERRKKFAFQTSMQKLFSSWN